MSRDLINISEYSPALGIPLADVEHKIDSVDVRFLGIEEVSVRHEKALRSILEEIGALRDLNSEGLADLGGNLIAIEKSLRVEIEVHRSSVATQMVYVSGRIDRAIQEAKDLSAAVAEEGNSKEAELIKRISSLEQRNSWGALWRDFLVAAKKILGIAS